MAAEASLEWGQTGESDRREAFGRPDLRHKHRKDEHHDRGELQQAGRCSPPATATSRSSRCTSTAAPSRRAARAARRTAHRSSPIHRSLIHSVATHVTRIDGRPGNVATRLSPLDGSTRRVQLPAAEPADHPAGTRRPVHAVQPRLQRLRVALRRGPVQPHDFGTSSSRRCRSMPRR